LLRSESRLSPSECHTFGSPRCTNVAVTEFIDKYIGQTRGNESDVPGLSRRYYTERDPVPQLLAIPASVGAYAHVSGGHAACRGQGMALGHGWRIRATTL